MKFGVDAMIQVESIESLSPPTSVDVAMNRTRADSLITIETGDFILHQLSGHIAQGETVSLKSVTLHGAVRITGIINSHRLYRHLVDLVPRIREQVAGINSIDVSRVIRPGA